MSVRTLIIGLLICCSAGFSLAQEDSIQQAYDYAKEGLSLVNKGKLDEALLIFEKGYALDSLNSGFRYEIAVIWYLKKEYGKTISILEEILEKPDANDQYYQILGNAYDLSNQSGKARKVYAAGIKRFPESGLLYLESGVLEYMHKNTPDAIRYWEAGIVANPGFTSNYYWLAKYYVSTTEKVWAALYGETFIALERNTDRTQEISQLLYDNYKRAIHWTPHSDSIVVEFTKSKVLKPKAGEKLPFEQVFNECMQDAADSLARSGADSLGYSELCRLRGVFVELWYRKGLAANYPVVIFSWIHNFPDPSYAECYHRWLFLKGNEDAFQTWYYAQPEVYGNFVKWFKKNPIRFSRENYISRSRF